MIKVRDLIERVGERIGPEDFVDPAFRAIFEALLADPGLSAPPRAMDPVAAKRMEELFSNGEEITQPARMLDDALNRLQMDRGMPLLEEIGKQLQETSDEQEQHTLLRQKNEVAEEQRRIGTDHSYRKLIRLSRDKNQR